MTGLSTHPLTPDRWGDLQELFGARGAVDGCWCMWFRQSSKEYRMGRGAANRESLRCLVEAGPPPGILAYRDDQAVGWCAIAPRNVYPRLLRSRLTKPRDDLEPWSIVCFFIGKDARGVGVSRALLDGAIEFARSNGAGCIEAYPVDPQGRIDSGSAFHGVRSTFAAAGFVEVDRRSPTRPIMRLEITPG